MALFILLLSSLAYSESWNCTPQRPLSQYQSSIHSKWIKAYVSQWFLTDDNSRRGTVVIVHGLNNPPSILNPLTEALVKNKFDVLRVTLAGHRGDEREAKDVSIKVWRNEIYDHLCFAYRKSKNSKIHFMGLSLGGALGIDFVTMHPELQKFFASMTLISPALSLPWYAQPTKWAYWFGSFRIPSFNNPNYRISKGTHTHMYNAIHELVDSIATRSQLIKLPVLALIHEKDRVISATDTKKWLKSHVIDSQLQFFDLTNTKPTINNFNHLFIDRETFGRESWDEFLEQNLSFLDSHPK